MSRGGEQHTGVGSRCIHTQAGTAKRRVRAAAHLQLRALAGQSIRQACVLALRLLDVQVQGQAI